LRVPDTAPSQYLKDPKHRAVIASSSNRRIGQWLSRYPLHRVTDIRGNVQTRLRKLAESDWDGAIFAAAGLVRLGLHDVMSVRLDWMLPAPAQGAMAVMIRADDERIREALTSVHDPDTSLCTGIERDVLHALEGGCSAPVGALATVEEDVVHLLLATVYPDGTGFLSFQMSESRDSARDLGRRAADEALRRGADMLIRDLRGGSKADRSVVAAGMHKERDAAATRLAISTRTVTSVEVSLAGQHGIRLMDYPVWQYRWIAPPTHLTATILAEEPQAWVFTSRRGVEGWWRTWQEQLRKQKLRNEIRGKTSQQVPGKEILGKLPEQVPGNEISGKSSQQAQGRDAMRIPPVYAVGDATADAVRRFFGEAGIREADIRVADDTQADITQENITQDNIRQTDIRVAERGDGKSLGEGLLRDGVRNAVHFCAVERRTELAEFCMKHGISLTETEVYQRTPVSNRKPLFTAFDALLFFSPDGVTEFFRVYGVPGGSWRPVAIGHTTAAAIQKETGRKPLIAASPSFEEMLKLV